MLAHAEGGLVARYYTEVLEGWQDCRVLFTIGTPHRGSVNALDVLANGYKRALIDLTKLVRSWTSTYQLLPIYKMLKIDDEVYRVAEVPNLPNINRERAMDALEFYREIETAVKRNRKNSNYLVSYRVIPVVGRHQPTLQSAEFKNGKIFVSNELPANMSDLTNIADGDGMVPLISAIPIEFSKQDILDNVIYCDETHGALQNNKNVLLAILNIIQKATIRSLGDIR